MSVKVKPEFFYVGRAVYIRLKIVSGWRTGKFVGEMDEVPEYYHKWIDISDATSWAEETGFTVVLNETD